MSNTPAVVQQQPERLPTNDPFRLAFQRLDAECRVIARSRMVPDSFRLDKDRRPRPHEEIVNDLMLVALDAQKRGIPFSLTTLTKYAIVNGAAFPMGQLLIGLVARHGHDMWIEDRSPDQVTVVLLNRRTGREHKVTYTMAEAKASASYKKNVALGADRSVWLSHPMDMLTWRAVNRAVRFGAPDIAAGFGFDDFAFSEPLPEDAVDRPQLDVAAAALDAPTPPGVEVKGFGRRLIELDRAIGDLDGDWLRALDLAWTAKGLPPLVGDDFGPEHLDTAEEVVAALSSEAAKDPSANGAQGEPATGPDRSPHETPARPSSDEHARPMWRQIVIQAGRAKIDHHHVIAAVTSGAKTSAKAVTDEEGQLVLQAIAAIAEGRYTVAERDGEWVFVDVEYAPGEEPFE